MTPLDTLKRGWCLASLFLFCEPWLSRKKHVQSSLHYLKMSSSLEWTEAAETALSEIKQALVSSAALALPDYKKHFFQMVDCKGQYMTSVLVQQHGDKMRPIAYFSSKLDSVACAQPPCVRAVIAASMAVEVKLLMHYKRSFHFKSAYRKKRGLQMK
uniref:Reverse transcriptase/retrotransposon-derived protein RNase H-like domain-containing protein n=1 Tax=Xiphophorus maculatus TaxID=8083 RepID=A0A3B5R4R1_XIPMA